MPYLDKFKEEERALLIPLPYRIGLWVSESDLTGGDESAAAEMHSLESLITGFAHDYCKSEFVQELMNECLKCKDKWQGWADDMDNVPAECERSIDIVAQYISGKDIDFFRHNLWDIAYTVAVSFQEYDRDLPLTTMMGVYFRYGLNVLTSRIKRIPPQQFDTYYKISQAERSALKILAKSLSIKNVAA